MSTIKFIVALSLLCLTAELAEATISSLQPVGAFNPSQTVISGMVYDAESNQPLPGAHIRIHALDLTTGTDAGGRFTLSINPGVNEVTIRVTHIGYRPVVQTFSLDQLQSGDLVRIEMTPATGMMSPVTVLSHRVMRTPSQQLVTEKTALLPIDSGAFLRDAGNAGGIRRGGFGIDPVLRGLSGSRLNVRLDGLTTTAAACPNRMDPPTSHIRLSDIERVEIHRGPHALQYGPSFGGTVNFVSHTSPGYDDFGMEGDFRAGFESNTDHRKTDLRLQGGSEAWDFLLSGGISSTGDYKGGSGTTVPSGFNSYDFGLETGLNASPSSRFTTGWSQSFIRDADFPALMMDMAIDDTRKFKAGYQFTPNQTESSASLSIDSYWSLVDHEMNNHNRSSYDMRDAIALAETETYGIHGKYEGLYSSGKYTLTAGFDHLYITGTRTVNLLSGPDAGRIMSYNLWQDSSILNSGFFSGIEHYTGDWTFSVGTRFDFNVADADEPAPRFEETVLRSEQTNFSVSAGISRQFSNKISAGLYVGRGVRSPDVTERYINFLTIGRDSYEYAGNPDLKAEANNQVDLVLKSDFGKFRFESTLFASYMTDYISAVINPNLQPVGMGAPGVREFLNRGDAFFTGFEFSMEYILSSEWFIGFNSSYTRAEYTDTSTPVAEIPPLETSVNLRGAVLSGRFRPELNLRRVFPQTRFDESFGESRTPGFWLADLNLSVTVYEGINLAGGVRNLLDEDYHEHLNRQFNQGIDPGGSYLPEPGRRFFAEMTVTF